MQKKHALALLASGSGSNAARFMTHFAGHPHIRVALVVSNNASAPVLERARSAGLPTRVLPGPSWNDSEKVLSLFALHGVSAIVLAGYMRLIPPYLIRRYPGRIFNIHPALLPSFGGKGMYGMHVHRAVIASGARESGISIHLVNERYDEGRVLFQKSLRLEEGESAESLAARVLELEHAYYPQVVENHLLGNEGPGLKRKTPT